MQLFVSILYKTFQTIERSGQNKFWRYYLSEGVIVNNTFYIGWKQTTANIIPVGLDAHTNSGSKIYLNTILSFYRKSDLFINYEKGLIDSKQFRSALRTLFSITVDDEQIDRCWNAMLLDIPIARLELLNQLSKSHRIFLLSNTNEIHYSCFSKIVLKTTNGKPLESYFEKAYYSNTLKMRKPDAEIFQFVLNENKLKATETLFLDDTTENILTAKSLGIPTFQVTNPELIFSLSV